MKFHTEQWIRLLAGCFILISVILAVFISTWWLIWTALLGLNLVQSVFTGFCLPETILAKFGVKKCCREE